jgi:hypothetical protein
VLRTRIEFLKDRECLVQFNEYCNVHATLLDSRTKTVSSWGLFIRCIQIVSFFHLLFGQSALCCSSNDMLPGIVSAMQNGAPRSVDAAGFLIDDRRSQAFGQVPVLALKKTPLRLQDGAEMQRRRRVFHSIRDHLRSRPETAHRFCLVAT